MVLHLSDLSVQFPLAGENAAAWPACRSGRTHQGHCFGVLQRRVAGATDVAADVRYTTCLGHSERWQNVGALFCGMWRNCTSLGVLLLASPTKQVGRCGPLDLSIMETKHIQTPYHV